MFWATLSVMLCTDGPVCARRGNETQLLPCLAMCSRVHALPPQTTGPRGQVPYVRVSLCVLSSHDAPPQNMVAAQQQLAHNPCLWT